LATSFQLVRLVGCGLDSFTVDNETLTLHPLT